MPTEVANYAIDVAARLVAAAGTDVVGVYLVGSAALGGYRPGTSDIDLLAVLGHPIPVAARQRIVDAVSHPTLPCPARGLELQVYEASAITIARPIGAFLVNLNTGPSMATSVSFDPSTEPAHWFVVDRAIAHRHGIALLGPPASTVVAPTPRPLVLDALRQSARWHAFGDRLGADSVLNACRALRFVADDTFVSKEDAAPWAIDQGIDPDLVRAALAARLGGDGSALDPTAIRALLDRVVVRVDDARPRR